MQVTEGHYDDTPHLRGRKAFKRSILTSGGTSTRKVESEFGTKMMKMMGWTEGQGLGLNDDGIKNPIQVTRRDGRMGLGLNKKEESWNDDWWRNIYSNAMTMNTNNMKTFVALPSNETSRKTSGVLTRSQINSINTSRKNSYIETEELVKMADKKADKKKAKKGKLAKEIQSKSKKTKTTKTKAPKVAISDDSDESDYASDDEDLFKKISSKIFKKKSKK